MMHIKAQNSGETILIPSEVWREIENWAEKGKEKMKIFFNEKDEILIVAFSDQNKIANFNLFRCFNFEHRPKTPDLLFLKTFYNKALYQELYRIDLDQKVIKQLLKTEGEIFDYNSDFAFYVPSYGSELTLTNYKIINLHTGEEQTLQNFFISSARIGSKYVFILFYYPQKEGYFYAFYDLKRKQMIITQHTSRDDLYVSSDFLDGKTPFYYIKKDEYCTIYNINKPNKPIGKVKTFFYNLFLFLFTFFKQNDEPYMYDFYVHSKVITEKTQYISDVEKNCIKFYRIKKSGLELADTLKLDESYIYETHLLSSSTKFVIGETDEKLMKFNQYKRIFLYDVNTKKIEYENRCYENNVFLIENDKDRTFLESLLAYAHGFQNSFLHIEKNLDNGDLLMPIEDWHRFQMQKKALKQVIKAFSIKSKSKNLNLRV